MELEKCIGLGKENRKSREQLMKEAEIKDVDFFTYQLSRLKKNRIVLFDKGYFYPQKNSEYTEFLKKAEMQKRQAEELIKMVYKEMKS